MGGNVYVSGCLGYASLRMREIGTSRRVCIHVWGFSKDNREMQYNPSACKPSI